MRVTFRGPSLATDVHTDLDAVPQRGECVVLPGPADRCAFCEPAGPVEDLFVYGVTWYPRRGSNNAHVLVTVLTRDEFSMAWGLRNERDALLTPRGPAGV